MPQKDAKAKKTNFYGHLRRIGFLELESRYSGKYFSKVSNNVALNIMLILLILSKIKS